MKKLLSAVVVVVFLVLLVVLLVKYIKNPKPIEGVDFFPEGSRIPKSERIENNGSDN